MLRSCVVIAVCLGCLGTLSSGSLPAVFAAEEHLVTKRSNHSVAQTLDRLSDGLKSRGIAIVARVDHAAAAEKAGLSLKPTQVLIFGNPKLGTPLMQSNRKVGLELPMKILAWEDDNGQVWVAYAKPQFLQSTFAVTGRDAVFQQMTNALNALSDEATK